MRRNTNSEIMRDALEEKADLHNMNKVLKKVKGQESEVYYRKVGNIQYLYILNIITKPISKLTRASPQLIAILASSQRLFTEILCVDTTLRYY